MNVDTVLWGLVTRWQLLYILIQLVYLKKKKKYFATASKLPQQYIFKGATTTKSKEIAFNKTVNIKKRYRRILVKMWIKISSKYLPIKQAGTDFVHMLWNIRYRLGIKVLRVAPTLPCHWPCQSKRSELPFSALSTLVQRPVCVSSTTHCLKAKWLSERQPLNATLPSLEVWYNLGPSWVLDSTESELCSFFFPVTFDKGRFATHCPFHGK